jgi:nucleoside-diphosphate-sugar epimerase
MVARRRRLNTLRVVVIGGTGHIGTYLVPRLVEAGHEVTSISRGEREPYRPHGAWSRVHRVTMDRAIEEANGTFGENIATLQAQVVIDLTCYTLESAVQLIDGLRGRVQHFLHCGTIWVHGPSAEVPTTEQEPRRPFGDYGCRKAAIESYLLDQARSQNFPATVLHPGHLVGPGWAPINPAGHVNPQVFSDLATERDVLLPNLGMETVHHVHVDDVAQSFVRAMTRRSVAIGESFHVVSPAAMTLRGYAERIAAWFGRPPHLRFLPWEEWRRHVSEKDANVTLDHVSHSPHCSIEKARALLGYEPRYRSLEAVQESVSWLMQNGIVRVDR